MRKAFGLGLAALATGGLLACHDAPTEPPVEIEATLMSHKPGHEPGGGGGQPGEEEGCQVEFDLTLSGGQPVHSDGGGIYSNGVDRVSVFTGSGPGFRFDTNGSQKLDARNDRRWIRLDFTGTAWEGIVAPGDDKGTDLRFSNQGPGLDLCTMTIGVSSAVSVDLPFEASDGTRVGLKYGGTTFSGDVCTAPMATVTRTSQTTWDMVSGAAACIVQEGTVLDQAVAMPFALTVTAQGAVP